MYVCAIFACLVPAEVKRDGIETNYWMVMSHHVGQGNEPVSSARRTSALNGWVISPDPEDDTEMAFGHARISYGKVTLLFCPEMVFPHTSGLILRERG